MGITIRPARRDDAYAIGRLAAEFATYLRGLGDLTDFKLTAEAVLRDGFGDHPAFSGLVAEDKGQVIGYLLYHFGYDTDAAARVLYIADLYVDQSGRRQGVGKALMAAAAEIARAGEANEMVWSVYKDNALATAFYESLGAERLTEVFWMKLQVSPPAFLVS